MTDSVDVNAIQREGNDFANPALAPAKADRQGRPQAVNALHDLHREQMAAAEPDEPEPWAVLAPIPAGSWRFVTLPGWASTTISLDIPVESDDRDLSIERKNKYKRWLERQIRNGRIAQSEVGKVKDGVAVLEADKAVYDLLGEYHINFLPVRDASGKRRKQAEYVTSEKVVADYIRGRLNRGDFPEIVEDIRPVMVEIDGELTEMMPVSEAGRRRVAMAAAAAG